MECSEARGALRCVSSYNPLTSLVLNQQKFVWTRIAWQARPSAPCTSMHAQSLYAGRPELPDATQVPRFVLNPEANWGPKSRHKPVQVCHPSIILLGAADIIKAFFN